MTLCELAKWDDEGLNNGGSKRFRNLGKKRTA